MVENPLVPSLRRAPPPATCTSPSAVSRAGELATPAPLSNRDGCRRRRRRSGRVRGRMPPPLNEQLPADSPPPSRPRTPAARRRWPLLRPYSPPPSELQRRCRSQRQPLAPPLLGTHVRAARRPQAVPDHSACGRPCWPLRARIQDGKVTVLI